MFDIADIDMITRRFIEDIGGELAEARALAATARKEADEAHRLAESAASLRCEVAELRNACQVPAGTSHADAIAYIRGRMLRACYDNEDAADNRASAKSYAETNAALIVRLNAARLALGGGAV